MKLRSVFKKMSKFLLVVAVLFGFISQTNAASSSLNFTRVNWQDKTSQRLPFSPGENFHIKYVTGTKTYAYCNDYPYRSPIGVEYSLSKEITDPGKIYILSKAPVSETNNNYLDYYIAQVAYWIYDLEQGNVDYTNTGSIKYLQTQVNNAVSYDSTAKKIRNLVDEAKRQTTVSDDITLSTNASSLTFTLSGDGKYYVSNDVTVSSNGNYSVDVKGPKGTIKEDISGGFRVKVPASSIDGSTKISATVTGTKKVNHAYLYKANSKASDGSVYQDMSMFLVEDSTKKLDLAGDITITTKVSISKVDATTSEELPGAKLTVKDEAGNVVASWTSSNDPHVIEGLKPGKYYLTEEIAPEGYELSSQTIMFEVKADGSTTKVVMENYPKKPNTVYISKQDATTGEELSGAHLELRDEEGNLIEAWVSSDEAHIIEGLKPGKYYLTEVLAPEGYELSTETVEFTVKEDGTVDGTVVMLNKPETIVEVPSTSSFKNIATSLMGIIVIGLGSVLVYRNYKKNEEI